MDQATAQRLNRAIDFIDTNLGSEIRVDNLSDISCFSKFHFHRLFQDFIGQTAGAYIKRLRLRRGVISLICRPSLPISEISDICGFSTVSNFSKAFSDFYGLSPSSIRKHFHFHDVKNFCKIISELPNHKKLASHLSLRSLSRYHGNCSDYIPEDLFTHLRYPTSIVSEKIEHKIYIYSRTFGPYYDKSHYENAHRHFSLLREIYPKFKETGAINLYLDRADYTPDNFCRNDAGIIVNNDISGVENYNKRDVAPGLYATTKLNIEARLIPYIWRYLFSEWIPRTTYEIDDRPAFNQYFIRPEASQGIVVTTKFFLPIVVR